MTTAADDDTARAAMTAMSVRNANVLRHHPPLRQHRFAFQHRFAVVFSASARSPFCPLATTQGFCAPRNSGKEGARASSIDSLLVLTAIKLLKYHHSHPPDNTLRESLRMYAESAQRIHKRTRAYREYIRKYSKCASVYLCIFSLCVCVHKRTQAADISISRSNIPTIVPPHFSA